MRIALIGDLHYFRIEDRYQPADEVMEARKLFFETYLHAFLRFPADLHISIGDLTHGGYPEEYEELYRIIRESGSRFRLVYGNHDVQAMPKPQVTVFTGHPGYEAIETEDANLVFLDTTKEMWTKDWGGEIDGKQLDWLKGQIVQSGEKPLLVFGHHPVWNTTTDSTEKWFNINPDTDIQSVLRLKQGPGFYFNGHNHVHSVVRKEQWHYIQTAAALCYPVFRVIEIEGGRIGIRDIVIDREELVRGLDTLRHKFTGFYFVEQMKALGQESDRSLLFTW